MALGGRGKRLGQLYKVPAFAAEDHRNIVGAGDKKKLLKELNRKERRLLDKQARKLSQRYQEMLVEIKQSGAGFPVDKILHELCIEYTHRYGTSGLYNQPLSFNYFDAFCDIKLFPDSAAPYARPSEEIDHLFSIIDYFEYATGPEGANFELKSLMALPEDKAFHFSGNGNINDFTFMTSTGREFVISGFSMIRRGNYLSWYIIGGEIFTAEDWASEGQEDEPVEPLHVPPWKERFLTEASMRADNRKGAPVPLEGTDMAQRTVIAGEIDLQAEKHLGRCYMSEHEHMFSVVCDDPDLFDYMTDKQKRTELEALLQEQAGRTEVMWRLGEALFQLPAYFAYKVQVAKSVVVSAGKRTASTGKKGGRGLGLNYKTVSALDFVSDTTVPVRSYTPLQYEVDSGGFWRRLEPTAKGIGRHGEDVLGRTWVRSTRPTPATRGDGQRTIYVKSTIASAKLVAQQYVEQAEALAARLENGRAHERNVLYVLRCALMHDQIYKVGWTSGTAEERAKQISSATGVPNSFIVVDSWQHPDAEALEKSVHAILDPYRVSDNREFFRLEYSVMKQLIENELSRASKMLS